MNIKFGQEVSEAVLDLFPFPVMKIGRDYQFRYMNPAASRVNGVVMAQLSPGQRCFDVLGSGNICRGCPVAKAFASGQVQQHHKYEYTPDQRFVLLEQTAIPVLGEDGSVEYVLEVDQDATPVLQLKQEREVDHIQTVFAFAQLIDARDKFTGKHSEKVSNIAVMLGKQLQLGQEVLDEISTAAMLHDIGKIGVPEAILMKPGRLTAQERQEMERHPLLGFEALSRVNSFERVAQAVLCHHERMDGRGYPHGISGPEIPLVARILSVADVFEALTARRVYRPALPLREVLQIMQEGRGTQFDNEVLDALLMMIRKYDLGVKTAELA